MYELYEAAYRARTDLPAFTKESAVRSRIEVVSFRITEVRVDRESGSVLLTAVVASPKTQNDLETRIEEQWVREDGAWRKRYVPPQLPFPSSQAGPAN